MWRYQKPGFDSLLLAALQTQQQRSQFCDTLLKAEGISVPVHSCVLSAVSPQISSALSSMPLPPAGHRRVLEFGALGTRTLLHVVRLLYSGEMAGESDKEKQEVISAAAKLGIHGLVEVTDRDQQQNEARGGQHTEVGVQTELHVESGARQGVWRREVRDGSTFLWKEILPDGQNDRCAQATQTEELDISTALPTHPTASLKTIDASALHSLGQTDSHFVHSHIPYLPISLVYQSDDNEATHTSSYPTASASAGHTSVAIVAPSFSSVPPSVNLYSNQTALCAADPHSRWTGPPGTNRDAIAREEWEDERIEQFQDNIPGFINYFLNPDREEDSRCRRAGRRQRARERGARSTAASESRPRGRRRGRLTEIVDVQDVGVSKLQKLFLQRGGAAPSRPGQGGGTAGRKLYLRTRELLKRASRRPQYSTEGEFSQSGGMLTFTERGRGRGRLGNKQRGGRNTKQQLRQDIPPAGRARRARAKPATSSRSSPPVPCRTLCASSPSLQVSPCPSLLSPVPDYTSPAASLLHTSSLPPPPAPPSQEEQPEHIDRLLEEVMMGLDILSNNSAAQRAEPADPNSSRSLRSICASSQNNLTQNKQNPSTDILQSRERAVGAVAGPGEGEGELTDILDHFLQSFEQHIYNCGARESKEMDGKSSASANQPYSGQHKNSTTVTQAIACHSPHVKNMCRLQPARCSQTTTLQQNVRADEQARLSWTRKTTAPCGVPLKQAGGPSGKARLPSRQRRKSGTSQDMFPSEKEKKSSESLMHRMCLEQDKQLQQRPVVRLERSDPLLVKAKLQGRCPSQAVKNPTKTKTSGKFYPTRRRLKEADLVVPSLPKPEDRGCKFKSNEPLSTLSVDEGPAPQMQPVENKPENRHEGQGEAWAVQPQGESEGAPGRGQKRRSQSAEGDSDDASVVKKVCVEQTAQPTTETPADCACEAAHVEDVIDVETVSVSSAGDDFQREKEDRNTLWSEILFRETKDSLVEEEMERDSDEVISVDGEPDAVTDLEKKRDGCKDWAEKAPAPPPYVSPPSRSVKRDSLGSTGSSEDEDIDVIGGSSPLPGGVKVSWTESSEREEEEGDEDVDVV